MRGSSRLLAAINSRASCISPAKSPTDRHRQTNELSPDVFRCPIRARAARYSVALSQLADGGRSRGKALSALRETWPSNGWQRRRASTFDARCDLRHAWRPHMHCCVRRSPSTKQIAISRQISGRAERSQHRTSCCRLRPAGWSRKCTAWGMSDVWREQMQAKEELERPGFWDVQPATYGGNASGDLYLTSEIGRAI